MKQTSSVLTWVLKEHLTVSNAQIYNDTDGIIIYQTPIDVKVYRCFYFKLKQTNNMKNLIIIISLLIFISCGYSQMNTQKNIIITEIEYVYNTPCWCNYYGQGSILTLTVTSGNFKFRDSCGKFQIGDALKIIKK